ncbi:endopolygalacturonase [Chthonomonas calidirosea]|uniref:glycosyl hydrolase family 28-related protein n=1 Tax=Chthonomonas calidirosea TaxID=454171 RepID=UPI0006DD5605|nr:glycosyl hydrolase family 28-related protein [Chthonomonas calidirosea]CEK16993.1 endopolygalacturonase [Chthonomonas calidirosea]
MKKHDDVRRRLLKSTALAAGAGFLAGSTSHSEAAISAANSAHFDARQFGVRGDGHHDDTDALQKALDAAGKVGGGIVSLPAGQYRINGHLSIPGGVTLQGTFRAAPCARHDPYPQLYGTVLLAYAGRGKPNDPPFIRLAGQMAALAGVIITYPEWKQTDVPPVPYPPTVLAEGGVEDVAIMDCCFLNTYEAIRLQEAHRHYVRNVYGYPHWRGLYVDACYDIGRVENCHFWPFGVSFDPKDPFCQWVNTNAVAFEFARTDWQYVLNTFCFGYGVGYKFSESKAGACNGNFLGIGSDSCERDILVEQAQPYGLLITNGEFVGRWTSTSAVCVEIGEKVSSKVSLSNCAFWGPIERIVWQRGPNAQFTASACHFVDWTSTALQIDAGKVIVQGCTFMQPKTAAIIGEQVKSAIFIGNQANGGLIVDNRAGNRTQLGFNEQPT